MGTGLTTRDTVEVLGCRIDRLDMEQTVDRCKRIIDGSGYGQHLAVNAAKLVAMNENPELRAIAEGCDVVSADGQSVVWASRLLGDPLPSRVAGIDLMHRLFELAESEGYRIYILGATSQVLMGAVERLRAIHPRLTLAGYRDGYFEDEDASSVAREIRASRAEILLVAMSSPRKEQWLGEYGRQSGVSFAMGVGGAIDVVAGHTRRAPHAWQRLGLEWMYRLLQEPRRLLRRYLETNLRFVLLAGRQALVRGYMRSRG
jgi:N-acetylglucosaminyldiphosphoundecaprenol N-acetyl-beta-D-mannosaminyltransferase